MPKLLSIVWYKILPAKFGGQKGIALFNEHLSRKFPLACLCSHNNEMPGQLNYKLLPGLPTNKWQFFNPFTWKKILVHCKSEKATHIILEHPYHGIAAIRARKATGAKLIVHSHNIESERFRQLGNPWWRLLRLYEKWVHQQADLNLFKTRNDLDWALQHFGIDKNKCMIIPYSNAMASKIDRVAARQKMVDKYQLGPDEKILLFAGTLDYSPNYLAVENIISRIVPMINSTKSRYRIIICGRDHKNMMGKLRIDSSKCIYAGEISNIDEYMAGADVFINPVNIGGGIQTKNIDALAAHCNLVCFSNMIEEETIELAGNKIFTASPGDWDGFVKQIEAACTSSVDTPKAFFEFYRWENNIEKLARWIEG